MCDLLVYVSTEGDRDQDPTQRLIERAKPVRSRLSMVDVPLIV